jgi:alpha-tubulin suppressor-like RCC1 family protein
VASSLHLSTPQSSVFGCLFSISFHRLIRIKLFRIAGFSRMLLSISILMLAASTVIPQLPASAIGKSALPYLPPVKPANSYSNPSVSSESAWEVYLPLIGKGVEPSPDISTVFAGGIHNCKLTEDGGVQCWGNNEYGQLGDGSTTNRLTPVDVAGLNSGIISISPGWQHTCALLKSGAVRCWGYNEYGQLGDGTDTTRLTPVEVTGLTSGIVAIAAGQRQTCALTETGSVKCWGDNKLTPFEVPGLTAHAISIGVGQWHACVLVDGGGVKCWGYNGDGQLGNGTTKGSVSPTDVSGLTNGVAMIAVGNSHSCALLESGSVKCWGDNIYGSLGDGTNTDSLIPVTVSGLTSVMKIASSFYHTCTLLLNRSVKCWGDNGRGQLGDSTKINRYTPVDVIGLSSGVAAISVGGEHTCALLESGVLTCWGANGSGQLGDGTTNDRWIPEIDPGKNSRATAIVAGHFHTCALTESGEVKCWGGNEFGQLGDGTTNEQHIPVKVQDLTDVIALAAGHFHNCALSENGTIKCWGWNVAGQLGDGTNLDRLAPVNVSGLYGKAISITAGAAHTCALMENGGVKCWGQNYNGILGDGTEVDRYTPVEVSGLMSGVTAISAGGWHTCALTQIGGIKCWGVNAHGNLGDGTNTARHTPVDVFGMSSDVIAIASGAVHTCALMETGDVKCWGGNDHSQLGDGTKTSRFKPVVASKLSIQVSAITAGGEHTCALTDSGGIKCWGGNGWGQLGDGTNIDRLKPVSVLELATGVVEITSHFYHTCSLTDSGGVLCWGNNYYGTLGDGSTITRYTPVEVIGFPR